MEEIILVFLIIAIALTFSSFIPSSTQKAEIGQPQETLSEVQEETPEDISQTTPPTETKAYVKPKVSTKLTETEPTISVNTYIVSGPKQGEVIEETTWVTFEWDAKVSPEQTYGQAVFEIKVEGLDDDWILTIVRERTMVLPPGLKEYTFSVRAIVNNSVDPTPVERTFTINTSPYFDKVRISGVQTQTSYYPSLITLSTQLEKEEEINITGWQIKGKKDRFVIPTGIEKYRPGYNPVPTKSIFIEQNDIIYLSGDSNPLGRGRNFRSNKCLGYLANYRDFPIPVSKSCPRPTSEEVSHLSPCCQEFILRMGSCDIPNYSGDFVISTDSECVSYLNKTFNYNSCFRNYSRDEDFLENSWHIYMKRDLVVSDNCDILYLRDQNGLFIDKYSYGYPVCGW